MKACSFCNNKLAYNEGFDAYYCIQCDKWMEKKCGDPACEFCTIRPEKPSDCKWIEE